MGFTIFAKGVIAGVGIALASYYIKESYNNKYEVVLKKGVIAGLGIALASYYIKDNFNNKYEVVLKKGEKSYEITNTETKEKKII